MTKIPTCPLDMLHVPSAEPTIIIANASAGTGLTTTAEVRCHNVEHLPGFTITVGYNPDIVMVVEETNPEFGMDLSVIANNKTGEDVWLATVILRADDSLSEQSVLDITTHALIDTDNRQIRPRTDIDGVFVVAGSAAPKPFLASGFVFHRDGSECNGPVVSISNQSGVQWQAATDDGCDRACCTDRVCQAGVVGESRWNIFLDMVSGIFALEQIIWRDNMKTRTLRIIVFALLATLVMAPAVLAEEVWNGSVDLMAGTVNVTADNSGVEYTISSTCAMYATIRAADAGGFTYSISDDWYDDYGALYFPMINDRHESGYDGWLYWVNYPEGVQPPSSNLYELEDGDLITWYWGSGMGALPEDSDMLIRIKVTITERGDLNHDGTITPADAVIALQIAARGEWLEAADMNCDGMVTSVDALMILQNTTSG